MALWDADTECAFLPPAAPRRTQRIRIAEHPLQVHLLLAVWTRLFLSHDAPASDTELMESEQHWSREVAESQTGTLPHPGSQHARTAAPEKGS